MKATARTIVYRLVILGLGIGPFLDGAGRGYGWFSPGITAPQVDPLAHALHSLVEFRWLFYFLQIRSWQFLNLSVFQNIMHLVQYLTGKHGEKRWSYFQNKLVVRLASNDLSVLRFRQAAFCSRSSSDTTLRKRYEASILVIVICFCISCDIFFQLT